MTETGTCEKCDSEISVEADRCPECGYEPASHGWIGSIGVGLSVGATILVIGFILIIWVVAIATSFTVSNALILTVFFGFIALIPIAILYMAMKKEMKTPTGETKNMKEELL